MAIVMIVPVLPARADLLDGPTGLVDITVNETTAVVDGAGTVLSELVDDTTDLVEGLSDSVTTVVDETEDALIGVVDATEDSPTGVVDDDVDTETVGATTLPPGTTTTVAPSTDPSTSSTTVNGAAVAEHQDLVVTIESDAASVRTTLSSRPEGLEPFEALTVLSAAHGLSDSFFAELVNFASVTDTSLYGRLLQWLAAAGSGVLGLLVGPVLALEILLRALTSAGSGLVAPLSLLGAYLFRLRSQLHVRQGSYRLRPAISRAAVPGTRPTAEGWPGVE